MKNLLRLGLLIALIVFASQLLSADFDSSKSQKKTNIEAGE